MSIESRFNVPFVAELALREKQVQQSYRPIIAVHKWFARRPGTLFRGLLLAEFGDGSFEEAFYEPNDLRGVRVVDPFMGGGTPLIEANRVGCDVEGFDVNPVATWIVREAIDAIDPDAYQNTATRLMDCLDEEIGHYYRTSCPQYGDTDVPVKSFLWVKILSCEGCGQRVDLFPGYLVARDARHPRNVLVCGDCGELNEVEDTRKPGVCSVCEAELRLDGPARRGKGACRYCGHVNAYPNASAQPPEHRLFAIEYHNPTRKAQHRGRFFKKPDRDDLALVEAASKRYGELMARFVPNDAIPAGDETRRLHRWGYRRYAELFNARQLLGLELSCRLVAGESDKRLRRALATNLSDLLRYQNMLCRYDTMALKALDIFSVHGFPVGLIQCESNPIGIADGNGRCVGSGGWRNIVQKYAKAKAYCIQPYEVRRTESRKERVNIVGERIGTGPGKRRQVSIQCRSAVDSDLVPASVDAVLTDPPYFGNVQYAELMDFCYVWLRRLASEEGEGFDRTTTRSPQELTGNDTESRGIEEFTDGLSAVYQRMSVALKPGGPLAFTYHHNTVDAYAAVAVAILDAGLVCTASPPCPAEMGGSIHIQGTTSSIIDTIFVCRHRTRETRTLALDGSHDLCEAVALDVADLTAAGRQPTCGDVRCILLGHATRGAVLGLGDGWVADATTRRKLELARRAILRVGDLDKVVQQAIDTGEERARTNGSDLRVSEAEKQLVFSF